MSLSFASRKSKIQAESFLSLRLYTVTSTSASFWALSQFLSEYTSLRYAATLLLEHFQFKMRSLIHKNIFKTSSKFTQLLRVKTKSFYWSWHSYFICFSYCRCQFLQRDAKELHILFSSGRLSLKWNDRRVHLWRSSRPFIFLLCIHSRLLPLHSGWVFCKYE